MTRYLLDTTVLSLLDPRRAAVPPGFLDWARRNEQALFASTMSIAEIEQGIAKLRRNERQKRADALETWRDDLIEALGPRLLPMDAKVARTTGAFSDALRAEGVHPGLADVIIGATAHVHDLAVLTLNERHFAVLRIPFHTPMAIVGA